MSIAEQAVRVMLRVAACALCCAALPCGAWADDAPAQGDALGQDSAEKPSAGDAPTPDTTPPAQQPQPQQQGQQAKPVEPPGEFEVSLSTGHSFPADKILQYKDEVDLIPTSSVFLLIEYFLTQSWRLRFVYDLPTTTEARVVRGELEEEVAPSTIMLGLTWVPVSVTFRKHSRLELQGTLLGGMLIDRETLWYPTWTGRIHLMQDSNTGVGVYLGVVYGFIRNRVGPFYGVGYRF